jgi:osmotically-inducible protein OsmY
MLKQGCCFVLIILVLSNLSGCIGGLWTGANMVYDRHDVYKKLDDYRLFLRVNNAITVDDAFKNNRCAIDVAVLHGDVLLSGHVSSLGLQEKLRQRISRVKGYRRLFNKVTVSVAESNSVEDSWITTKIRSQIFADDSIDPNAFKVVTSDRVVYLMGDVHQQQGVKVVNIARRTTGVVRVVKILRYFTYQNRALG